MEEIRKTDGILPLGFTFIFQSNKGGIYHVIEIRFNRRSLSC